MLITVYREEDLDRYEVNFSGNGIPTDKVVLDHDNIVGFQDGSRITKILYSGYVGKGVLVLREALDYDHPENLYNFIKRHDIEPERFGIEKPRKPVTDDYDDWSKEDLIKHIRRLEKQIESGF